MDTAEKYKIAEKILQIDDDLLLNEIEALVGLSNKDFGLTLPPVISAAIDKAKAQLDAGEGIPHNKVMEEIKARFPRK